MVRPAARVLALLELQAGGTSTVADLAQRLAVDERTLRRVLPAAPARRIDAVLDTVGFTAARDEDGESSNGPDDRLDDGSAQILLVLAEAARDRRPVTFGYTVRQGRAARRSWALFAVPAGTDPVQQVICPLSAAPWRHDVSFRIHADIAHVRTRIPETLGSVTPVPVGAGTGDGWLRVFLRAERLEWVEGTLVMLDRPFVIESPPALHETVAAAGHRLAAAAAVGTGEQHPADQLIGSHPGPGRGQHPEALHARLYSDPKTGS